MFRYHVFAPYPHLIQHCTVLQFFSPLPSGSHWGIGSHWLLLLSIKASDEGVGVGLGPAVCVNRRSSRAWEYPSCEAASRGGTGPRGGAKSTRRHEKRRFGATLCNLIVQSW